MIAAVVEMKFGPWRIWFDPPPIPVRCCDWHYQHEDTDLDCPAWMNGSAATFEACLADIIDSYEDRLELAASGACINHPTRPVRDTLDGDALCQECCDQWARNEGNAQAQSGEA